MLSDDAGDGALTLETLSRDMEASASDVVGNADTNEFVANLIATAIGVDGCELLLAIHAHGSYAALAHALDVPKSTIRMRCRRYLYRIAGALRGRTKGRGARGEDLRLALTASEFAVDVEELLRIAHAKAIKSTE